MHIAQLLMLHGIEVTASVRNQRASVYVGLRQHAVATRIIEDVQNLANRINAT